MDYENRVRCLLNKVKLQNRDVDTIIIWNYEHSSIANTQYFSGFTGSFSILVLREDVCYIITDSRYFEQVKKETKFQLIEHVNDDPVETLVKILRKLDARTIGFEQEKLSVKIYKHLCNRIEATFVPIDEIISDMRAIKTDEEINLIRKASSIAEKAFVETLSYIKEGVTENDVCSELEYRIKKLGGQIGFETLIGSGSRTSMPHVKPSNKRLNSGEPILLDFGARINSYCCDITRMVYLGTPDEEFIQCYTLVKESLSQATSFGRAGLKGFEIDSIARKVIMNSAYSSYCFKYGLGHGIGLEVHEAPKMAPSVNKTLPKNAVLTVEPGIYIPGKFGIRIENDVVVKDSSFETITQLDIELIKL